MVAFSLSFTVVVRMLSLFLCMPPFRHVSGTPPIFGDWLHSKTNFWENLAHRVLNTTDFCLASGRTAADLFSTCLIGIPLPLESFRSHTPFTKPSTRAISYKDIALWGRVTFEKEAGMIAFRIARSLPAEACFRISHCPQNCQKLPSDMSLHCNSIMDIPHMPAHIVLPMGWFLVCGRTAYSYLPANATLGTCALGKLSIFMPSRRDVETAHSTDRARRGITGFDASCDSDLVIHSHLSFAAAAIFTPGIAAAMNYKAIKQIACAMVKSLNYTSKALAGIAHELSDLKEAVLDNRAAIDYLLLKQKVGCQALKHMCCFNLTDSSRMVEDQADKIKELANNIKIATGVELPSLWDWLPSLAWLKQGLVVFLIILALIVIFGCCGQYILGAFRSCSSRRPTPPAVNMPLRQLEGFNAQPGPAHNILRDL